VEKNSQIKVGKKNQIESQESYSDGLFSSEETVPMKCLNTKNKILMMKTHHSVPVAATFVSLNQSALEGKSF
jgi:hypothetical protein